MNDHVIMLSPSAYGELLEKMFPLERIVGQVPEDANGMDNPQVREAATKHFALKLYSFAPEGAYRLWIVPGTP